MSRTCYFVARYHRGNVVYLYVTNRGSRVFARECMSIDDYKTALGDLRKFIYELHLFQPSSVDELFTIKLNQVTSFDAIPYGSITKLTAV